MAGGIALYERALTYNAKHADALYNLGVACGETNQIARAIFLYELAIHFNPSCAETWNNLGVLQRDMGNFESEPPSPILCVSLAGFCVMTCVVSCLFFCGADL